MHGVFALMRLYPFWAVPLAIVIAQLGVFFRRKARGEQWACWGAVAFLLIGVGLWMFFRGDINSDRWVKAVISRP